MTKWQERKQRQRDEYRMPRQSGKSRGREMNTECGERVTREERMAMEEMMAMGEKVALGEKMVKWKWKW